MASPAAAGLAVSTTDPPPPPAPGLAAVVLIPSESSAPSNGHGLQKLTGICLLLQTAEWAVILASIPQTMLVVML